MSSNFSGEIMIKSRAPARISFAGGGTDLPEIAKEIGGCVTSVAISKYVYGSLKERDDNVISITSISPDKEEKLELDSKKKIVYGGKLDLIKSVIEKFKVNRGFDIVISTDIPSHSGLGVSSAAFVATIGLFNHYYKRSMSKKDIAELAFALEVKKLKNRVGKQDQYASSFGGLNYIEFKKDMSVNITPLKISKDTLSELEKNILLFYISKREKTAGETIANQTSSFTEGKLDVMEGFRKTKELGIETRRSLEGGNLKLFGDVMAKVWEYKKLFGGVTTPFIEDIYNTAIRNGAYGGKISGAGGGGCGFWFCRPGKAENVKKALEEKSAKNIPFSFDFDGLKTWESS
jgi:D-glycero-alpha-D-manno-heptose-7-phosphate kinase